MNMQDHSLLKVPPISQSNNQQLLKVLKETRGAWGPATKEELKREKKQREVDLEATRKAKEEVW